MDDLTGRRFGAYHILGPLGEGGMAAVYWAHQEGPIQRDVAIKVMSGQFANSKEFATRFMREAGILAGLRHPRIVPIFDYGQADGYTYLVMPFIDSGTLAGLIHNQPLPLAQIRQILPQIADALDYAHAQGIVHRDVKPNNVLVDERGNCYLSDFGISKLVHDSLGLTTTNATLGTPAYMSPEQATGDPLDGRSDIYSLGIVLYQMATGRVPYRAETPMAVLLKHVQEAPPSPRALNPAVPKALEKVILRALAKSPNERYATAAEFGQAVRDAIPERDRGWEITKPGGGNGKDGGPEPAKKRPWAAVGIALALVAILAALFLSRGGRPVYDDFNDPAYDGKFNPKLWSEHKTAPVQFRQEDGALVLDTTRTTMDGDNRLSPASPSIFTYQDFKYMQARLKLGSKPGRSANVDGFIKIQVVYGSSPNYGWAECQINEHPGEGQRFECLVHTTLQEFADPSSYRTDAIPVDRDTWHTARIELNQADGEFRFYLDGIMIGRKVPEDIDVLAKSKLYPEIGSWTDPNQWFLGYFDDVEFGR